MNATWLKAAKVQARPGQARCPACTHLLMVLVSVQGGGARVETKCSSCGAALAIRLTPSGPQVFLRNVGGKE